MTKYLQKLVEELEEVSMQSETKAELFNEFKKFLRGEMHVLSTGLEKSKTGVWDLKF